MFQSFKSKALLVGASAVALASPAFAGGGGVTIPDFGVDGPGIVTALTTDAGSSVTAAVGLGAAMLAVRITVTAIKSFWR